MSVILTPLSIACIIPPVTEGVLFKIVKGLKGNISVKYDDPRIWLCPRCTRRNPDAAKQTIAGGGLNVFAVSVEKKDTVNLEEAGIVSLNHAHVLIDKTQLSPIAISIDDEPEIVEISRSTAETPKDPRKRVFAEGLEEDDEIQIVPARPKSRMRTETEPFSPVDGNTDVNLKVRNVISSL